MKKVLVVANSFPPMGGAGVQRSLKFVKHLRKFGYEPVVLTRDMTNVGVRDETLMQDIPEGVKIVRTKAYETEEWKGILKIPGKVIARLMIPDGTAFWSIMSRKAAEKLVKEDGIEYIYTTSAPYSAHLLGRYIKKRIPQIKWVADFRDEWTNNPYTLDNPHNVFRTKIEKNMEKAVMLETDALVTNTPVMKANFLKNHNIENDKFYVIPNGYDEEDFVGYEKKEVNNQQFTLVYTGALYGRRKPDTFFEALRQLIQEEKVDGGKIKVKLMGNYYRDRLQKVIDGFDLTKQIEIVGYVPHDVCIREQMCCDVLILIEGTGPGANAFYTGKLFEYMNTGKPVLALLPEQGVAATLVRESNIGIVADTDDVEMIKENLLKYYNLWKTKNLRFEPNQEVIAKYERKKLTEKLAKIFDSL